MPAYAYTALHADGSSLSGVIDADAPRHARQLLRDQGLTPIHIDLAENTQQTPWLQRFGQKTKLSAYDLALFTRQLSVLSASAIPLDEALRSIAKQTEKKRAAELYLAARSKVLEGYSLADALTHIGQFPDLMIASIRAGEKSGKLDLILQELADFTESRHALQQKVKTAMIYPIILLSASALIVLGLMTFIVPRIVESVSDSGQAIPLITLIIMRISQAITHYWPVWIALIIALVVIIRQFMQSSAGKLFRDRVALRAPIFQKLTRNLNAARFASTLSILTRSSVPLVEALRISAEVSPNHYFKEAILSAADRVVEGSSLATPIERSQLFPPMMVQMIKSGEHSGELPAMLKRAADMQEREATNLISALLALMEPIMLVILGVIVFVIILSVMLPILNMNDIA